MIYRSFRHKLKRKIIMIDIKDIEDFKSFSYDKLSEFSACLREEILESVSKNGG